MTRETTPTEGSAAGGLSQTDEEFLAAYYEHVAAEDIHDYSVGTLELRAREHLSLAAVRPPGTSKVAVVNERNAAVLFVVADDMQHVVRSVIAELTREDVSIRLVVHPTFEVLRDPATHELIELRHGPQRAGFAAGGAALNDGDAPGAEAAAGSAAEIWIAVEIGRLPDSSGSEDVVARLQRVLADVRAVAEDSGGLRAQVVAAVESLDWYPSGCLPPAEQLRDLLPWLEGGNFEFLGYCEYGLTTAGGNEFLQLRSGSELGLLRAHTLFKDADLPTSRAKQVLTLSTSGLRSTVEARSYLDEIRLTIFDAGGAVAGERCFVGLFTPGGRGQSVQRIPVVRDKVAAVRERLGFASASHEAAELLAALELLPLEELFHADVEELTGLAGEILRIQEHRQTRVFLLRDSRGRFLSALMFLPRHRLSTAVRVRMEQELKDAFNASSVEFDAHVSESSMARVLFRILLPVGATSGAVDPAALERNIINATRTWAEGLDEALKDRLPSAEVARLSRLWSAAFPAGYRADLDVEDAVEDLRRFEEFDLDGMGGRPLDDPLLAVSTRPASASALGSGSLGQGARIRLYLTSPRSLTQMLPFFHNLGLEVLDQRPFELVRGGDRPLFLYNLGVKYPIGVSPAATSSLLADAFVAAMRGEAESDRFDALVLREGLGWRHVAILRAYAKYLLQLGTTNSYDFIADALLENTRATRALLGLFRARFDPALPASHRLRDAAAAQAAVIRAIDPVASLDADRLLRTFLNLIEATTRTNFFRDRPYLSFKLQPSHLPAAPHPRPRSEIWVYSPRVEGVHLRFGPLARGGIRWSERREDFRTEVLGLAKAQIVKNSVIVPTGAKGGFYPKRLLDSETDRAAWLAEGTAAYKDYLRGLLDVTDNLTPPDGDASAGARGTIGRIVPPPHVVRHDDDDYYLVVAADKGTAAFSDIANDVAGEYGYWLGDAFASGGSVGYDHKRMGITARGAWESARAHLHELGIDPQRHDFTVAGIGDMSGDVFGNGMLLSGHIRLVAAFDHRHIFLDPTPDAASSLAERRRLFDLPRSSWADYNPAHLSPGGGVHPRAAKSIPITPQVREALGLAPTATAMTPPELIQAILRAPVDLVYNGGIGTYVKATAEGTADVGDKANDAIRVNGNELRARTVVEGGNLGLTQRGRIEAALNGVLLNTDAIDNSAGVDCSDHEVNIKIFIDSMIAAGKMPASERADFLHSLENDVASQVLKNNQNQNTLLRNDRTLVLNWSAGFERTVDWLEKAADLYRGLEALPTTDILHGRLQDGKGLTAPELSVLAAHAKIALAKGLNDSDVADDPWFDRVLRSYFPPQIADRFGTELETHPLRRQIICTVLANDIINLGGITFAYRAIEETTATAAAVARGFVAARDVFDLQSFMDRINGLPPEFPNEHAAELTVYVRRTLDRATRWYVSHDHRDQPIAQAIARIRPAVELWWTKAMEFAREDAVGSLQDVVAHLDAVGFPTDLGRRASYLLLGFGMLDISLIAEQVDEPVQTVANLYFNLFQRTGALKLLNEITGLPRQNRWETLARAALRDDAYSIVADLTVAVMRQTRGAGPHGGDPIERIEAWERGRREQLTRVKDALAEVAEPGHGTFLSIPVALKLLRTLVRS